MKNGKDSMVVVLGAGAEKGQYSGARFAGGEATTIARAAKDKGLRAYRLTDASLKKLAIKLPEGDPAGAADPLAHPIPEDLYEDLSRRLAKWPDLAIEVPAEAAAADQAPKEPIKVALPEDLWSAIAVGSLVLAPEPHYGWWEAIVMAVEDDGETMTVRWRDYPREPQFKVRRRILGLMGPATS